MIDDQVSGFITNSANPEALAETIKSVLVMSKKEKEIIGNKAF